MNLSPTQRQKTGAFYTPKLWATLAVSYIQNILPDLSSFLFYDPAGGEGTLLQALPQGTDTYATTLENEDVDILRDKGIQANQFDFLNGNLENLLHLKNEKHRLVVFTNPPFVKLPASDISYAKRTYKTNDAVALFYYRILLELKPLLVCGFTKVDIMQAQQMGTFRKDLDIHRRILSSFICPSSSWEHTKGNFPILFSIMAGDWYY